ncbi:hypothetical protein [Ancylobacter oerskovii]|uniref:Uncharacterized protein n=1 Tax=Ancylobacter oerskovii TaxID=459519 RepID=A0ABW4Z0Y8_9HYPH|nr:hypothetical protein [Ancylobacter oerskovii]MBS7542766.1 hypothetical protein [Ancylobacter oerskovii]
MRRAGIELHIDRLVVEGIAPTDAAALRRAVERELARRLAAPTATATDTPRGAAHVDAGVLPVPASAGPQRFGTAIADRVLGGLKR